MVVILHNIRSLHNVGSIFRTADAAGIEKIYLCGITPAPVDRFGNPRRQFVKVSLGAEKNVPWEKTSSTIAFLKKLSAEGACPLVRRGSASGGKKGGYKIFAIEQDKRAVPYYKMRFKDTFSRESKLALVVGNEIKGLPRSILKYADKVLEIPMTGKKESLNVSVAFGVVVFHLINL